MEEKKLSRKLSRTMNYYKNFGISPGIAFITGEDVKLLQQQVAAEIAEGCDSVGHQKKQEFLDRLFWLLSWDFPEYDKGVEELERLKGVK